MVVLTFAAFFSCEKEVLTPDDPQAQANIFYEPTEPISTLCMQEFNWTWTPIPGFTCGDGSGSGIGVRRGRQCNRIMIFLDGGTLCFDGQSCNAFANDFNFDGAQFGNGPGAGVFYLGTTQNPFRQWTQVYVPNCTGDLHTGDTVQTINIGGVPTTLQLRGARNFSHIITYLKANFPDATEIALIGASGGSFGATFNFNQLSRAYPAIPKTLIADCGIMFEDDALFAPCLQQMWRDFWNVDANLPSGCATCFGANGDGLAQLYPYYPAALNQANYGLMCYNQDIILRLVLSKGYNNCPAFSGLEMTGAELKAGLAALRDQVLIPAGRWGTFLPDGEDHTAINLTRFYTTQIGGVSMAQWTSEVLNGNFTHYSE